jgi:hypothetical protein
VFRITRDALLTKALYRRVPVLIKEGPPEVNPWGITFKQGLFNMAADSKLFRTAKDLTGEGWELDGTLFRKGDAAYLPLYEAKMLHHFDHRWGTYEGQTAAQANQGKLPEFTPDQHNDPSRLARPRYWVPADEVADRLKDRWDRGWLLGWRDTCRNTDVRTTIASVLPRVGVGHKFPLCFSNEPPSNLIGLSVNLQSFILDYVARQKVGGTSLTFFLFKQFPILPPQSYAEPCPWFPGESLSAWLLPRVVELTYTAWDLQPFAADCGFDGPPFRWDEERRFLLRGELDAAFFHLYLGSDDWQQAPGEPDADFAKLKEEFPAPRQAAEYILDTFPVVRAVDEQKHQRYRTKEQILALYDALAEAARTGQPYRTPLDPPPADPRCRHSSRPRSPTAANVL